MHRGDIPAGYPRGRGTCDLSNDFRWFIKNCSFPLHSASLAYRLAMPGHAGCRISECHGSSVLTRKLWHSTRFVTDTHRGSGCPAIHKLRWGIPSSPMRLPNSHAACPVLALSAHSNMSHLMSLSGVKRTSLIALQISACDPKRTWWPPFCLLVW